ncbi:MAG TPA: NAD(P)-dependent oxidoreductase [Bacillota bacterium]|nr:NAD(P)-dependent oxidoreductase [Bacillota bacterium]
MKICMLDCGQFINDSKLLDPLRKYGEVSVYQEMPETVDELVNRAHEADVVAFAVTQIGREAIDRLPNLKMVQFIGTGMWNFVDVDYAESKGIAVRNIDAYGSNAVAEFALAMTFALMRNIVRAVNIVKSGAWDLSGMEGSEIAGSTVGVVGTGSIGRLVAEKFIALGANVVANDIFESDYLKEKYNIEYLPLDELFRRSDIVTLHMKVTKENEKIINSKLFSIMKKNSLFINVARAELVDLDDLYEALTVGNLGGAAIDVYSCEPLGELDTKLTKLPNVICTPHIGFYSKQANDNSIRMSVDSIVKYLEEIC